MFEEDCYRHILTAVGSVASEGLVLGCHSAGVSSDLNQAMTMALRMVEVFGMGERLTSILATGGGHSPNAIREAEYIVNATRVVAEAVIDANRDGVEALAQALIQRVNLSARGDRAR